MLQGLRAYAEALYYLKGNNGGWLMKKYFNLIFHKIYKELNKLKLNKKFVILYFFCVFIPLVVTDVLIINIVYEKEVSENQSDMNYVASLYTNSLYNLMASNQTYVNSINMNRKIDSFLNTEYESSYEYYDQYFALINDSFLSSLSGLNSDNICVYADNDTILDSSYFKKLSGGRDSVWYKMFMDSGEEEGLYVYYDEDIISNSLIQKRGIYYIKRLTYYRNGCEKIAVVENDPAGFQRDMKALSNRYPMYIRYENYVIFTNMGDDIIYVDEIDTQNREAYVTYVNLKNTTFEIVILNDSDILAMILKDQQKIILVMIFFSVLFPFFAIRLINQSIIMRILELEKAFAKSSGNVFKRIEDIDGTDEIAGMMRKYNEMADANNNLINMVYKNRLKEQENDIARKNAELLALQSQINPHFLFNALESIRMHSLLKGETETSVMVGKLALMQRQNVEWGQDFVTIKKEMESIEAYLGLQSYRFSERLKYEIDMNEDCADYLIPKLTVVTFVENACVHGIEPKQGPGWIFVRVYRKEDSLFIEVEDTGGGMGEDEVREMLRNINNVSIETLKGKKHIGILNACLRLKMISSDEAEIRIDSEEGVGMIVEIKLPLDKLDRMEGNGAC